MSDRQDPKRVRGPRWKRVFALRRTFTQQIVWAGMTDKGPAVSLTDALDDLLYHALQHEGRLAERRTRERIYGP